VTAYYNEIDLYAAEWLRNLIKAGHIPHGEVDTRSIVDVQPSDLAGYTQCHFFAGIGGWGLALRLAGWPDDRPVWTGSCPCQPFSVAGKRAGTEDSRHLWPNFYNLIAASRPPVVMGEQVAGAAGYGWLDGVVVDLETEGYSCGAVDIPACAVNAPHIRQRIYWVAANMADADNTGSQGRIQGRENTQREDQQRYAGCDSPAYNGDMADADQIRCDWRPSNGRQQERSSAGIESSCENFWSDVIWLTGADGKARRSKSGLFLLAHGIPARVGRLRAYGNAIVPPLAAEVIKSFMETLQ
jgi:DNA (cytosine-5)-methyltransferase 1